MSSVIIDQRLKELVQILSGERGNAQARAVRLKELNGILSGMANGTVKVAATDAALNSGLSKTISEAQGLINEAKEAADQARQAAQVVSDDLEQSSAATSDRVRQLTERAEDEIDQANLDNLSQTFTSSFRQDTLKSQFSLLRTELKSEVAGVRATLTQDYLTAANTAESIVSAKREFVTTMSQSVGCLKDAFLNSEDANNWVRVGAQGDLTKEPGETFIVGTDWTFDLASGEIDGIRTDTSADQWVGALNADAYALEILFTLNSGSLNGALATIDWQVSGASHKAGLNFADGLSGPLTIGQQMRISAIVQRPSGISGTITKNVLTVLVNGSDGSVSPSLAPSAKNITLHEVSLRPATAEEQGGGLVDARVTQETNARSQADLALADDITSLTATLNSTTSSVSSNASAIADLEGNAQALVSFRAKAGSSGALLELVAQSNPSGSVSVARIAAVNILLDGSVYAQHLAAKSVTADKMNVGTLSAITATIGVLRTATTGARMEIRDNKISVYDSANTLRVVIGDLS
ncbi:hypothetical protein DL1_08465 [Thioclava dalianensis]|uniref:Uncharacterized protein n=1 Tax=Thioclava dalianensis TaxID=1185766 RepID=A0A074TF94_9RHOB|nr:hypothetical protein [Thioclava dalianensis]KEP68810.1 hypothetical protein DL1_08465 [Thioclava dalianensis]SFN50286.1 hypothetical protein SAMN05216224_10694 [Thioclava dalianensis]